MTKAISKKKVMKAAWTKARKAAIKHGGRPIEYIRATLKSAWKWAKKNLITDAPRGGLNIHGTILRETDKALQVELAMLDRGGNRRTRNAWLPKSRTIQHDATTFELPDWLFNAKLADINAGSRAALTFDCSI